MTASAPATPATSLRAAENWIYKLALFIACVAIAGMVLLTFIDVLGRQFFSAVPGANEIIYMLLGTAFYAGMSPVERHNSHILVGILVERYPPLWQKVEAVVTRIVSSLSMVLIAWLIINQAGKLTASRTITEFLGVPIGYLVYLMGGLAAIAIIWAITGPRNAAGGHGAK